MHVSLTRRTQILLDDELHGRLRELAESRGISIGSLVREAIEEKLSLVRDTRAQAIDEFLALEPMPVDDWPVMKKELLETRYAAVTRADDDSGR